MGLRTGTRLGPYEILSAIGAGGMGEVYRARDTRLDRIVAIKVLPAHLADEPERRERFEREARTIASLNHPHICVLHDIGRQDGIDFLVMEYLDGETLAQRLLKGPLPLEQVLQYAIEISDALDKAHRKGITHRDLKPSNIMLTKSGTKLLDFGLAKLRQEAAPTTPLSELPTEPDAITAEGAIVGTLRYMTPEQLESKGVDARTDIFAFGSVVYEMATGKRAFEGKSQASIIGAIMSSEPLPMSSLHPMTPPALDRLVRKCLAKEPEKRWQAASDVCDELKWIGESSSRSGVAIAVPGLAQKNWLKGLKWAAGAVLVVSLGLGVFAYFGRAPEDTRTMRYLVYPPDTWTLTGNATVTSGSAGSISVSPDGRRIAFLATGADGKSLIWVRSLETLAAQSLTGTDRASSPFWSPDSHSLGFFAGGKLKKIDVSGGPPITLCDAPDNRGGTWSQAGVIVFTPAITSGLQKVSASGGVPSAATKLNEGETGHFRPFFLPDGRHFIFRTYVGTGIPAPIYVGSLDSFELKRLSNADSNNVVYAQGHLLFLRERTLMAQPFDSQRLVLTGEPFPIAEQIQTQGSYGVFSASESGILAYQTGVSTSGSQLAWFDRAGKEISVLGDSAASSDPALSPDGKRASESLPGQPGNTRDIWLYDIARGLPTRFTFGPANAITSIWSPDGSRLIFNSDRKGHYDLYQKDSSGAGAEEVLLEDTLEKAPTSWSLDGRSILYTSAGGSTGSDIFVLPFSGDRKPMPFLKTQFNECCGQFSPDGRWVTYTSNESGRNEVYVAPFPGPGGKRQISTAGGANPRWRHDGTEIFYLAPDNKLIAAAVNGKGLSFEVGAVKPLFQTRGTGNRYRYDVSSDGQRFLINSAPEQSASTPITVVVNWTAGLKK